MLLLPFRGLTEGNSDWLRLCRSTEQSLTHLFLRKSRRFGLWRCWCVLISAKLSLPKCWVPINCLLRRLLPWFSAISQSVFFDRFSFIFSSKSPCRLHQPTVVPLRPIVLNNAYMGFHSSAGQKAWMRIGV